MLLSAIPRNLWGAAAALMIIGCSPAAEQNNATAQIDREEHMIAPILLGKEAVDIHSYARPAEARVFHVALDLAADFEQRRMAGTATLDLEVEDGVQEIVLDSKGLEIQSVTNPQGEPLQWNLGAGDEIRGQPLTVRLNGARKLVIGYRSAPDAAALQWLAPEQTAGKKHPFLFSQGQAILNRTWIPTQDSPGVRQTWEARIVAPEPLKVVMSAESLSPGGEPVESGGRAFRFRMDKPVAPYLIAIAAGDIAYQRLGERSDVYAEPSMLKAAANELADTERMIEAAERLYGDYRWGRYDSIVLPPAFPFGGMENPRLTFLTPTMIAGDRSLVSLQAHELAHSWSGNLVTNATWSDFWLNEGFTSYIESRIMEEIFGARFALMEQANGWEGLMEEIEGMGGMDSPQTRLHIDLEGKDPDDGMTSIAYNKGEAFLRTIEEIVGRDRWDPYLRSYFDRFAFQPMTTRRFVDDLRANLIQGDRDMERRLQIDEWLYGTGIPASAVAPRSPEFERVDAAAQGFASGQLNAEAIGFGKWSTAERLRFLNALPRQLPKERLEALDRTYNLTDAGNNEVLFAWLRLTITNRYEPAVPAVERFLTSMGRRKFVAPLFEALVQQGEWGRPIAERIYERARPTYHSVTSGTVDRTLGRTGASGS
jgi:leukotriene-A4 hydrolase